MGKRRRYKHSYNNPNLVPKVVVDKQGKPTVRLVNPRKKDKKPFDMNNMNDKEIDTINTWAMDNGYTRIKNAYLLQKGLIDRNDFIILQDLLNYRDTIGSINGYIRDSLDYAKTLDTIFSKYQPSGVGKVYRGLSPVSKDTFPIDKDIIEGSKGLSAYIDSMVNTYDMLINAKKGDTIEINSPTPTSWTRKEYVAVGFTNNRKLYSTVLEYSDVKVEKINNPQLSYKPDIIIEIEGDLAKEGYYIANFPASIKAEEEVLIPSFSGKFQVVSADYRIYKFIMGKGSKRVSEVIKYIKLRQI